MTVHYSIKEGIRIFFRVRGTVYKMVWLPEIFFGVLVLASATLQFFYDVIPPLPDWYIFVIGSTLSYLGVYMTGIVYDRFWEMRYHMGMVMGRANDLSVMMRAYVCTDDPKKSDRLLELKKRTMRFVNMGHALCYWQAQNKKPEGLQYIQDLGLMSFEERSKIEDFPTSAYLLAFAWVQDTIYMMRDEGFIPSDTILEMLVGNVTVCRQGAYDVFMFLNTPMPLPYFHMFVIILVAYFCIIIVFLPSTLNDAGVSTFWSVPIMLIQIYFFFGLGGLAAELENPFEFDANDFNTKGFITSTTASSIGCGTTELESSQESFKLENDYAVQKATSMLPCLRLYDFTVENGLANGCSNDFDLLAEGEPFDEGANRALPVRSSSIGVEGDNGQASPRLERDRKKWDMMF